MDLGESNIYDSYMENLYRQQQCQQYQTLYSQKTYPMYAEKSPMIEKKNPNRIDNKKLLLLEEDL